MYYLEEFFFKRKWIRLCLIFLALTNAYKHTSEDAEQKIIKHTDGSWKLKYIKQ